MKNLICLIVLFVLASNASAQANAFLAVGFIGPTEHDLFMGAAPAKVEFVSTPAAAFEAVPKQPDQVPKPAPAQAPQKHLQAPIQAPTVNRSEYVRYEAVNRRVAPLRRGWLERRAERRSIRASRRSGGRGRFLIARSGC